MKRKLNIIAGALMMTAFICVPMLSGCSKTKSVSTEITVEKAAKLEGRNMSMVLTEKR